MIAKYWKKISYPSNEIRGRRICHTIFTRYYVSNGIYLIFLHMRWTTTTGMSINGGKLLYMSKSVYASRPWLPTDCLSLSNARLSICLTISCDNPHFDPISNKEYLFPHLNPIPYLSLIIFCSLSVRVPSRLRTCFLIDCLSTHTSGFSTTVSAVTSCRRWVSVKE